MKEITKEYLRECLTYDPASGLMFWKTRPLHHFKDGKKHRAETICSNWNSRYAGEIVGRVALHRNDPSYRYIHVTLNGRTYMAHRLIMLYIYGAWPEADVDHIDRDHSNNAWENLRHATRSENQQNRSPVRNKHGLTGVSEVNGRFVAQIKLNGVVKHVGCFGSAEDAHQAYLTAKRSVHPFNTV